MRKTFLILSVILIICVLGIIIFIIFNNSSTFLPKNTTFFSNHEYCSMENNCPTDRCYITTSCAGGSDQFGCAPGPKACNYKDTTLKEKYFEYTIDEAK